MNPASLIISLVIICTIQFSATFLNLGHKTKIELKEIKTRHADNGPVKVFVNLKNSNNRIVVNGNFTISEPIGQAIHFKFELQVWSNGQWIKNVVNYQKDNPCIQCKVILGSAWEDFEKAAGLRQKCPYLPGFYQIENYYVNASGTPIAFAVGRYKLIVNLYKQKKWILEEVLIADIVQTQ